ncbi:MAG: hypothetical protein CL926_12735 [Deltaproteobacteria bacterium]|nr:hypothetical protein [Deltaproteobacteria bacterium]
MRKKSCDESGRRSPSYFRLIFSENPQTLTVNLGSDSRVSVLDVVRVFETANCCFIPYELVVQHLKWDWQLGIPNWYEYTA